jgi:hypothetical protein
VSQLFFTVFLGFPVGVFDALGVDVAVDVAAGDCDPVGAGGAGGPTADAPEIP